MSGHNSDAAQALTREFSQQGVRYALASYVDLHGICKAKAVPLSHLGSMLQGSELFTGAALDGVPQDVSDDEVAAVPDPASATVLPWHPDLVWMASDLHLRGQPFEACSRNILHRVQRQAAAMGLQFDAVFAKAQESGFHGINITYPYKERVTGLVTIAAVGGEAGASVG